MTFIEIVRRIKLESGRGTSGPDSIALASGNDRRLVNWAAQSWLDIQKLPRNWRWMRKSVTAPLSGAGSYSAASLGISDWGRWVRSSEDYAPTVFDPSNPGTEWALKFAEYEKFRSAFIVGTHADGEPVYWAESPAGAFLVGPDAGGQTLRVDYWQEPVTLVQDSDVPSMPSQHHMLIVWGALLQVAGFDAAPELMTRCLSNYDAALSSLTTSQGERIRFA